jgi:hypothetical protein
MANRGLLVSLVIVLSAGTAAAGTIRVPQDQPTIQDAVNAAMPDDEILVKKGRYTGTIVLNGKMNITVRGQGSTLDAEGAATAVQIDGCKGITFAEFRVKNATSSLCVVSGGSFVVIQDCSFTGSAAQSGAGVAFVGNANSSLIRAAISKTEFGVTIDLASDAVVVEDCKISKVRDAGVRGFGHASVVRETRITKSGGRGIDLGDDAQPNTDCFATHNVISNAGEEGIRMAGSQVICAFNKVTKSQGDAYRVLGDLCRIEDNQASAPKDDAFTIDANNVTVRRNKATRSGDDSFRVLGNQCVLEDNRATSAGDDAFEINGANVTVLRNTATKPKDDGFEIGGEDGLYEDNTSTRAKDNGFALGGSGNTLRRNKATKSGAFDLGGSAGPPANTVDPDNVFTKTAF